MRTALVTTFPGLFMFGKWWIEPKREWRVMFSKRDRAAIRRAQEILEAARQVVDDPYEWQEEHRDLAMAESGLSEMIFDGDLDDGIRLSDYAAGVLAGTIQKGEDVL